KSRLFDEEETGRVEDASKLETAVGAGRSDHAAAILHAHHARAGHGPALAVDDAARQRLDAPQDEIGERHGLASAQRCPARAFRREARGDAFDPVFASRFEIVSSREAALRVRAYRGAAFSTKVSG